MQKFNKLDTQTISELIFLNQKLNIYFRNINFNFRRNFSFVCINLLYVIIFSVFFFFCRCVKNMYFLVFNRKLLLASVLCVYVHKKKATFVMVLNGIAYSVGKKALSLLHH